MCVWAEPSQIALVREVARVASLDVVAAGCWATGQTGAVAGALEAAPAPDLRAMLASMQGGVLLIAAAGDFGGRPEDLRAMVQAWQRGVRLLCLDPVPQSVFDLSRLWRPQDDLESEGGPLSMAQIGGLERAMRLLAMPSRTQAFVDAVETLAAFGTPRSAMVRVHAAAGLLSLSSRLIGGFDLLDHLFPGFEHVAWIDACRVPRGHVSLRASSPPDSLRGVDGDLAALVRFPDGRGATVHLSDSAPSCGFCVELLSSQGLFRIDDDGHEWLAPDGSMRSRDRAEPQSLGVRIGLEMARQLRHGGPDTGPVPLDRSLAAAQTALLSAHTGHPESPSTMIEMARRVEP